MYPFPSLFAQILYSPPGIQGQEISGITNKVYGVIYSASVYFPLPQADACKLGVSCPMKAGVQYTESVTLYVSPYYPSVSRFGGSCIYNINNHASRDIDPAGCAVGTGRLQQKSGRLLQDSSSACVTVQRQHRLSAI